MAQTMWKKHKTPSFSSNVSHIFNLNDTKLLVLLKYSVHLGSLWSYNILNENYTKICDHDTLTECRDIIFYTASLDNSKLLLYLFGENRQIVKLNLKTKEIELSDKTYHDGSHSQSLFINKQFHIFGGWDIENKSHFIWNENEQNLIEICKFEQIKHATLRFHSIHYLKCKNSVLIIPNLSQQIYLYSLSTNVLTEMAIKLSHRIDSPTIVMSRNEQYVIIFEWSTCDIFVLDLKAQIFRKSNITIDKKFTAFTIMSNIKREELLCFGYIRKCWKSSEFSHIRFLPYYLIKMIDGFFAIEMIHTMDKETHLSINIDDIITN